jgi:hypothetical protein
MSCVILNSSARADARLLMAAITRQREVQFFIYSVARETSLDMAAAHREDNASANDHFGVNEATTFKVSIEPRIERIARIRLWPEDRACRVRQLLAGAGRVSIPNGRS